MISIHNLTKDYTGDGETTHALRGVSFSVTNGEFVSIMGPSGSGKSTLLHILSLLDRPTGGSYTFLGKNSANLTDHERAHVRNKEMGFVFQSFNLLARSTVYENVELPLLYSAVPISERQTRIIKAIRAVALEEKLLVEAGRLSGGQKQRVAIARALVVNPNVIFADEPTGNLDSVSGEQVMEILRSLNASGTTIILVTHETYTSEYAERLIRLRDGHVEYDGPMIKSRRGASLK
jgi:putative ABC transport system ATP-binding protein